jgi:ornithine cyclodeaminase/alanine dehydrogenase-like protein (mu-crystallin family)
MASAIEVQSQAFKLLAQRRSREGLRALASSEKPPGIVIFNPCLLENGAGYGIKVISDFYENESRGMTRMTGLVCLFDGLTGYPQAVLEAGYLTDLRTGAATALAARHLARPNSRILTIIGAGRVARNQLLALAEVFDLETVFVASRSRARVDEFISHNLQIAGRMPRDIRLASSAEEAVGRADIVVAATTSEAPVICGEWLRRGTFVAAVGAHKPSLREVDSETIRRACCRVIDSRADSLDHAGDLAIPIAEGIIGRADVAELAELVVGARPSRRSDEEITFFKSVGAPIQDLVTAQHILKQAKQKHLGTELEIGGESF